MTLRHKSRAFLFYLATLVRSLSAWMTLLIRHPSALRFLRPWLTHLRAKDPVATRRPWIVFSAAEWIDSAIRPSARTFEWGSGGSTCYFLDHGAVHTSVEHDAEWHADVEKKVLSGKAGITELILRAPRQRTGETVPRLPDQKSYANLSFTEYIEEIDRFPDSSFDFILIDGRARTACAKHAKNKIREGGSIILDNSERPEYAEVFRVLAGFERRDFWGPGPYNFYFWRTTVFTRPRSS